MASLFRLEKERRFEILGVLLLAFTTLLFLALVTDEYQGASRRYITNLAEAYNALGTPGAVVAGFLYILLGQAAHILYCLTGIWGMMLLRHKPLDRLALRFVGLFTLLFSVAGLLHLDFTVANRGNVPGGAIGAFVASIIEPVFGIIPANVIALTLAIVGVLLATEFLFVRAFHGAGRLLMLVLRAVAQGCQWTCAKVQERRKTKTQRPKRSGFRSRVGQENVRAEPQPESQPKYSGYEPEDEDLSRIRVRPDMAEQRRAAEQSAIGQPPTDASVAEKQLELTEAAEQTAPPDAAPAPRKGRAFLQYRMMASADELPPDYEYPKRYTKPGVDLLDSPPEQVVADLGDTLRQTSVLLEEKLLTFGVEARVTEVTRGPTITRFELEPAPGVKVSRFLSLADDLALALKAHRVRVVAPIPGKGRVGIEVPNEEREPVVVRELLESPAFRRAKGTLNLALGKDIAGDVVLADLASMPHLLVAGATGAGKTVCVKALLASLLFTKSPEELQLMLVDPKMVELSIFNEIPHLITPVVTDPKKAASALNWLIVEMEERYRLLAHLRMRNIEVYNERVENGEIRMGPEPGRDADSVNVIRKLPYIVCVIDELADLMMLARAEVEDAIGRLAQLARAVGIHLIIATQRPSVDVLTGVIKANFPARISFQVSSRVDSRCILDEIGAERLIGRGDMLYLPAGRSKPARIQGAFVSDEEMMRLISYLKTQAPPQYRDEIERFGKSDETLEDLEGETDELFDEAVRVVLETGQASISMVQRRLRVGYTRAARLIDMMELKGIVGPHLGSKAREILVDCPNRQDEVA